MTRVSFVESSPWDMFFMLGAGWAGGILASCGHEEKKKMSSFACRVVSQLLYPFFSLSLSLSPDSRRVWSATSRGADGPCPKASERPQNPRWCPSPAPGAAGPWRTPASLVTMRRASNVSPLFFCYPFPRSLGVSKLSRTFFFFFFCSTPTRRVRPDDVGSSRE